MKNKKSKKNNEDIVKNHYWNKRKLDRLSLDAVKNSEKETEKIIKRLNQIYNNTADIINKEIDKIIKMYKIRHAIDEEDVIKYLNNAEAIKFKDNLFNKIKNVDDPEIKKKLITRYNSLAYMYRIERQEALKANIASNIYNLGILEQELTEKHYKKILENKKGKYTALDIKKRGGSSFSNTTKHQIKEILENKWSGKNFSTRIWENKEKLIKTLEEIVTPAFLRGEANINIANELTKRFDVSKYQATRLVRTENAYFQGQATLRDYIDTGITKYKFIAKLDNRTSKICRKTDEKEFLVENIEVGVNYPPLHPFCRSTTIPVIEDDDIVA